MYVFCCLCLLFHLDISVKQVWIVEHTERSWHFVFIMLLMIVDDKEDKDGQVNWLLSWSERFFPFKKVSKSCEIAVFSYLMVLLLLFVVVVVVLFFWMHKMVVLGNI